MAEEKSDAAAMADEMGTQTGAVEAMADDSDAVAGEQPAEKLIEYSTDIQTTAPCERRVKITVPRSEVDRFFDDQFDDLVKSAAIPGFRPGHTPRRLVERRFRKDVSEQVKLSLISKSLEQLEKDRVLDALDEPDFNMKAVQLPDEGDFSFEFSVEVAPEFEVPAYEGLEIDWPMREIDDAAITGAVEKYCRNFGNLITKEGAVEKGDFIVGDVRFLMDSNVLNQMDGVKFEVQDELVLRDGTIDNFAVGMAGAKIGDTREFASRLSNNLSVETLRGVEIKTVIVVKEINQLIPCKIEELVKKLGVADLDEIRRLFKRVLENQLSHEQNESAQTQILAKLTDSANWELPQKFLKRQSEAALRRQYLRLKEGNYDEQEINSRMVRMRQDVLATTAKTIKQQLVLQKIAEQEQIKVDEQDIDVTISQIAAQNRESPRKLRARIYRENMLEELVANILETKTLGAIVKKAKLNHVTPKSFPAESSSALDESAVPQKEAPTALAEELSEASS